jgi:hypothetical protein
MLHLSSDDLASVSVVVGALEAQIAELGPASKISHLWNDWAASLGPASKGGTDRHLELILDLVTPGGFEG